MKKFFAFILALLGLQVPTACGQMPFENRNVDDFAALLDTGDVQLLDVRTPEEYAADHLVGAINIDVKQADFLRSALSRLDKSRAVAVYCRSGRRSAEAARTLVDEGFKVVNLKGGILAWTNAGKTVTKDTREVDVFVGKTGKRIAFHALMHASIRIEFDGKEIEIDPVGKLGDRTTDYAMMPKADIIFVTHEHGDHYDPQAIQTLSAEKTRLVTNRRCADMLGKGQVMKNGDADDVEGIRVEAVPAYNTTPDRTQFHPKGRDNGFVLTLDGLRVYIAGDTEDIPEMATLGDIDIAFMPCNQPYTMTTDQLVKAARMVKPRVLFPYHYGKTDVTGVPEALKDLGTDVRIRHYE